MLHRDENPENNNQSPADEHKFPFTTAMRSALHNEGRHQPYGNHSGVLYNFGHTNANPEAKGISQLNKLREHIEGVLNNVAASIGGCPTQGRVGQPGSAYDDFFERGHREEYALGSAKLLIEVMFTMPGSLKLVIRNITAEYDAKVSEQDSNRLQRRSDELGLDKLVGLYYEPGRAGRSYNPNVTTLPGNEYTMTVLSAAVEAFAEANNLATYVQGMLTERLTYVFLDQDAR